MDKFKENTFPGQVTCTFNTAYGNSYTLTNDGTCLTKQLDSTYNDPPSLKFKWTIHLDSTASVYTF